jgi:glutaminase
MKMSEAPSQPVDGPIENVLQELHARLHCLADGSIVTYIPELAGARSEWFGLSVATLDGHIYGSVIGSCRSHPGGVEATS